MTIDETWPPACQELNQRWHRAQQRLKGEQAKLSQAAENWRQAAFYEELEVSGRLFGAKSREPRVKIPPERFEHYRPDWESDALEPNWKATGPDRPTRRIDNPSYYDVRCSRESFVEWLKKRADADRPVVVGSAQAAAVAASSNRLARQSPSLDSAREAISELWPNGRPKHLRAQQRNDRVNERLREKGLRPVSDSTIGRALRRP